MQDKNDIIKNPKGKKVQSETMKSLYAVSSGSPAVLSFSFPFNLLSLWLKKLERLLEVSGMCKLVMG